MFLLLLNTNSDI